MARLLVTVGSDELTNWVRLPDGSKMSLGAISMLSFVTKMALSSRTTRLTLDHFLQGREVMFTVNEDKMWDLLTPRRARWAAEDNGSFMAPDQRTTPTPTGKEIMATIKDDLHALEQHIDLLNKHAATVSPEKRAEGFAILNVLAQKIKSPNQSNNSTPTPPEKLAGGEAIEDLTFDRVLSNKTLAAEILTAGEETVSKIDSLIAAGQNFNSDRAKADVLAVTGKVAGILRDTELTEQWINTDLQKLAARAEHLHGLFLPTQA